MPLDSLFDKQGIRVLGTPLGHPQFVEAHLNKKIAVQEVLLERIPAVPDLQSSWSLLLHCASARANFLLRVVKPEARGHTHSKITRACGSVCARSFNAIECGWHGFAGRNQSGHSSMLGELGRLHAHDFQQAPRRRKLVHARTGRSAGRSFGSCSRSPMGSDWSVGVRPTNLGGIGCRSTSTSSGA